MPETPDFLQIARDTIGRARSERRITGLDDDYEFIVAEQFRLVWNARGAADLAKIDALELTTPLSLKSLDRALRSLDR